MANPNPRPICPTSRIYNEAHFNAEQRGCVNRHILYDWRAKIEGKGTLIADSLLKWAMELAYLDVQAKPGMRLDSALRNMQRGLIQIQGYEFCIFACGTNDIHSLDIQQMHASIARIIQYINQVSPFTTIGIASILPRPQDTNPYWDIYRKTVNCMFKQVCNGPGQGRVEL